MKYALALSYATGALAAVHTVEVGKAADGSLANVFTPDVVTAAVGDTVEYTFYPNHDIAQGPFGSPCSNGNGTTSGPFFYSGRLAFNDPNARDVAAPQKFVYQVTDTTPKWYYCTTGPHCNLGMVGVINPPASGPNTLAAYREAAASAQKKTPEDVLVGGNLVDSEGGAVETGASATPAPPAATPSGANPPSGTSPADGTTSTSPAAQPSGTGAAAGLSVGSSSSVLALLAGVAAWLL